MRRIDKTQRKDHQDKPIAVRPSTVSQWDMDVSTQCRVLRVNVRQVTSDDEAPCRCKDPNDEHSPAGEPLRLPRGDPGTDDLVDDTEVETSDIGKKTARGGDDATHKRQSRMVATHHDTLTLQLGVRRIETRFSHRCTIIHRTPDHLFEENMSLDETHTRKFGTVMATPRKTAASTTNTKNTSGKDTTMVAKNTKTEAKVDEKAVETSEKTESRRGKGIRRTPAERNKAALDKALKSYESKKKVVDKLKETYEKGQAELEGRRLQVAAACVLTGDDLDKVLSAFEEDEEYTNYLDSLDAEVPADAEVFEVVEVVEESSEIA